MQINPLKNLGPDGMHSIILLKMLGYYSQEYLCYDQGFLKHGQLFLELNRSNITLIPKKANSEKVNDYRPISLYKGLKFSFQGC